MLANAHPPPAVAPIPRGGIGPPLRVLTGPSRVIKVLEHPEYPGREGTCALNLHLSVPWGALEYHFRRGCGRAIAPAPVGDLPDDLRFLDGEPGPEVRLKPGIERGLKQLWEEIHVAGSADCHARIPGFLGTSGPPLSFLADPPGHDSTPVLSAECILCGAGCGVAAFACSLAVLEGCAALGPFYGVCVGVGLVGCAVAEYACFEACHATGAPCCPVSCGEVACCAKGETCMDSSRGLCCSPGFKPCAARSCCPEQDACIATGPNAGTCCPQSGVCGPSCCGSLGNCEDPVKGVCCSFGEVFCGGKCCEPGDACIGGSCCPAARSCGNICCGPNAACLNGQCETCPPGDYPCPGGGCCHLGYHCTDTPNSCCTPDHMWCGGECKLPAACIK